MGVATNAEIKALVDANKNFNDIFETAPVDAALLTTASRGCPTGFTSVNTAEHECLKVKTGMEKFASRVETRRYGAMLGCTVEFNKMEVCCVAVNHLLPRFSLRMHDCRTGHNFGYHQQASVHGHQRGW